MKRGIKSLLYSKKILDKYHLNIDTKNFKNIVVKLNKKTISFNFETGEKIKFLNRDSNICNFFIEKNMVIEKIYYEENGKILFVIYDHEIGLCKFNSFENYCYKKNKGLLQDSENYYSVCKNYEIPNFIPYAPYKQNFNCPGKYFDEKLFSYFIKSTFFNEQYDGEFIDYKVLCNNVILTQNKDREEFEISNSDLRMKGLFHISKNEQYIYKLNHKNFKIMKYDRKSKKEVLFLNLHNFNLEKIFYFYISDNELFLTIISDKEMLVLVRKDKKLIFDIILDEKTNFIFEDIFTSKNFQICDSDEKHFVYIVNTSESFNLYIHNFETFQPIIFPLKIESALNTEIYFLKLFGNKIKFYTHNEIFEIKFGNQFYTKRDYENLILDEYNKKQDENIEQFQKYLFYEYENDVFEELKDDYVLDNYHNPEDEKITQEKLEELEEKRKQYIIDYNESVRNNAKRRKLIEEEKTRNKIKFPKILENKNFKENKIYLVKWINIYPFLGIKMENNILINYSLSNNGDMMLLMFSGGNSLEEKNGYYKQVEDKLEIIKDRTLKGFMNNSYSYLLNIFLIDKDYKTYFLSDEIYKKIGSIPETCFFSYDDNNLLFIYEDEIYKYDISYFNKRGFLNDTLPYFKFQEKNSLRDDSISKFTGHEDFDKNLMKLIYQF